MPIGRPLADVRAYVLDENLQPVDPGQAGKLCLAGTGVARGYHQRPALTAERFAPDPFSGDGSRMYRTGNIVRTREGMLEFVDRQDRQVKVRGFRTQLGEIENRLTQRADVSAAVVVTHEDRHGDNTLYAYLVPRRADGAWGDAPASAKQHADPAWGRLVLEELHLSLPAYMVPLVLHGPGRPATNPQGQAHAGRVEGRGRPA
ncbi:AMP-binding protein [Streptomyces sp. TS71-3]|uniref:AMP-binding protein n=1 Tax=Streptomyces sp. TS71-3 TaxID=2733862 RepID=UPI001B1576CE|nr:AMP-binding protein [Streptomyces sp. TS71-3]GHJ39461.1 hypothetical protein Sm713_50700 [Streptomyces sp. TS71-3]